MMLQSLPIPGQRPYPPRLSAFTRTFWEGLREGKWQTTCCAACNRFTFPPKTVCPHCWSRDMQWKPLSKRGTLYAWTRVHAPPKVFRNEAPYAVCCVDLDVGLRIAARLVELGDADFRCGTMVEMVVLQYEDGPLFAAQPVPPAQ